MESRREMMQSVRVGKVLGEWCGATGWDAREVLGTAAPFDSDRGLHGLTLTFVNSDFN